VCLIEEYCKGGSLDDVLYGNRMRPHRKPRRLPYSDLLHIATDVSAAMAYLHPSIVHRDLKPSNVLLTKVDDHTNSYLGVAHPQPHPTCCSTRLVTRTRTKPVSQALH
jgi:serine/threonine protein kinase